MTNPFDELQDVYDNISSCGPIAVHKAQNTIGRCIQWEHNKANELREAYRRIDSQRQRIKALNKRVDDELDRNQQALDCLGVSDFLRPVVLCVDDDVLERVRGAKEELARGDFVTLDELKSRKPQ